MKRLFAFVLGPNYIIYAWGFSEQPQETATLIVLKASRLSSVMIESFSLSISDIVKGESWQRVGDIIPGYRPWIGKKSIKATDCQVSDCKAHQCARTLSKFGRAAQAGLNQP